MSIHGSNDDAVHSAASTDSEVLFAVVHAEGPVSVKALAEHLDAPYHTVYSALIRLFEGGLVLRRETRPQGHRTNQHEYIAAHAEGHEPHIGPVSCSECGRESNVLAPGVECTYRYCDGVFTPP